MNKSSKPDHVRRLGTIAAGFAISVIGICAAAPSAFARVVPPEGGGSTASLPIHHGGISGWEIALIVVGAVVVIGLSLLATVRYRNAAKRPNTALAGHRTSSISSLSRTSG
jgi:hypothetical protein